MRLLLVGYLCVAGVAACAEASGRLLELHAGTHRIEAEVADTPDARARGLMHRHALPPNRGMLFVYPRSGRHCMWMRNTALSLSVAFLNEDGDVINVADMAPRSDARHCASAPARYALEMNAGWFKQHEVGAGTRIEIPAAISAW
jgi:uncharacterized membrane protein (UPF0127 family)